MDFFLAILVIAGWIALQKWILPKFGISTGLEPNCRVPAKKEKPPTSAEEPSGESWIEVVRHQMPVKHVLLPVNRSAGKHLSTSDLTLSLLTDKSEIGLISVDKLSDFLHPKKLRIVFFGTPYY